MKMKNLVFAIVAVLMPGAVHGQLTLSAGESFTYNFNTLPFFGEGYTGFPPGGINYATFESDPRTHDAGDAFRVEIFETSASDTPSAVNSGLGSITAQGNGGWHDLQGVARVTVTSGTLTLNTFSLGVYRPTAGSPGEFESFATGTIPVPEPGAIALWSCAAAGLFISLRGRTRRSR